jgi:hypothetical protein
MISNLMACERDDLDLARGHSMTRLERTAIHESAHVIVTASQFFQQGDGERIPGGVFLTLATIVPTEENLGGFNLWEKTDSIHTRIAILMAGGTATYLSTRLMPLYDSRGDADFISERMGVRTGDILSAWGSLLTGETSPFASTGRYGVLADSFELARRIIFARWHEIEQLADHLLVVREMNCGAIQRYLAEHDIKSQEWRES